MAKQKLPKLDFTAPIDTTRVNVSMVNPPDQSIYSNPVTQLESIRTPITPQIGSLPNMQFPTKFVNPSQNGRLPDRNIRNT